MAWYWESDARCSWRVWYARRQHAQQQAMTAKVTERHAPTVMPMEL
jgi:hypothetical protein